MFHVSLSPQPTAKAARASEIWGPNQMGWVEEQFERRIQSSERTRGDQAELEKRFEVLAEQRWSELVGGLQEDVDEYQRLGGDADLRSISETEYRISNYASGAAAKIVVDLPAHTIQYTFESEKQDVAVPEGGFFSIRRSGRGAELYSADQRITPEQARRMILEPILFPNPPRVM